MNNDEKESEITRLCPQHTSNKFTRKKRNKENHVMFAFRSNHKSRK